jgi:hypothetical protein
MKKESIGIGTALNLALSAPEAAEHTKRYAKQQAAGVKKLKGTHAPGGAPPMRKVSAKQALHFHLKKQAEEKTAEPKLPFGSAAKALPWALLAGAGIATGGMVARGGAGAVGGAFQKFQSSRMFKELQQRYPEIRRHKDARKYFDLIVAYAPSLMRHHAAVGDFLTRQLQYPMSSVEFIKQLADLEATVSKTEGTSAASRFGQSVEQQAGGLLGPMGMEQGQR